MNRQIRNWKYWLYCTGNRAITNAYYVQDDIQTSYVYTNVLCPYTLGHLFNRWGFYIAQVFAHWGIIYYVHKVFRKTNFSNPLISTPTCVYQRVRNVSFLEYFAYVLNGWCYICNLSVFKKKKQLKNCCKIYQFIIITFLEHLLITKLKGHVLVRWRSKHYISASKSFYWQRQQFQVINFIFRNI